MEQNILQKSHKLPHSKGASVAAAQSVVCTTTSDTYRIRLSNGYDSGEQVLTGGNIQIR